MKKCLFLYNPTHLTVGFIHSKRLFQERRGDSLSSPDFVKPCSELRPGAVGTLVAIAEKLRRCLRLLGNTVALQRHPSAGNVTTLFPKMLPKRCINRGETDTLSKLRIIQSRRSHQKQLSCVYVSTKLMNKVLASKYTTSIKGKSTPKAECQFQNCSGLQL